MGDYMNSVRQGYMPQDPTTFVDPNARMRPDQEEEAVLRQAEQDQMRAQLLQNQIPFEQLPPQEQDLINAILERNGIPPVDTRYGKPPL